MIDFDYYDFDLDELFEGILDITTIGLGLLLLPSTMNFVTIHLLRQFYAEERQKKKRQ
jgi:hypothetical protein